MKLSEFIKELQKILDEGEDLEVFTYDSEHGEYPSEICIVGTKKNKHLQIS